MIRSAQLGIANSDQNTYLAAQTAGLALRDEVHFNTASNGIIATELADTAYTTISASP